MNVGRLLRHVFTTLSSVRRAFPATSLDAIETAIRTTEATHQGQIRFAVEHALDVPQLVAELPARERAIEVFSQLRVWDTERNNGVLIYLLFADRDVEIVADRGIHAKVGAGWEDICRAMEQRFRNGEFEQGVIDGIRAVSAHLSHHFPSQKPGLNELPDRPVLL
ncbi:MAG: TPM domain-containing protein [Betaproteobacteria bacterium]